MVHYKKGNLLEATEDIIAHGVNCAGGFGSGVAGQIATKYPTARKYYLEKFRSREGWGLGDVQIIGQTDGKEIANCATQFLYLPRDIKHADYSAIEKCMKRVKLFAQNETQSIAIPRIGAGLAGGNWNIIKLILEDVFNDYDCTVYEV